MYAFLCVLSVGDMYIQWCRHVREHTHIHTHIQTLIQVWNILVYTKRFQTQTNMIKPLTF